MAPLREQQIHDKIFGTLARPLSRFFDDTKESMGLFSDSTRIQWTHFGRKHRLNFSKEEIEYMDLFEAMMKKIYNERPEFDGLIAYNDHNNRQIIINSDSDLRNAMHQMKGKLKLYTTLPERGTLAAADMAHGRQNNNLRSHSVPPPHSRYSPIQDNRAPSSLDYNYRTYDRHQNQNNHRQTSFDAPPQRYERSHSSFSRGNNNNYNNVNISPPPSSYNNGYNNGRQMTGYQSYQSPQIPPTYQYSYSSYNNSNLPYPGPAGPLMPQQNMYLNHYLNGNPGAPPVAAHAYAARSGTTFIGPNKLLASSWGYPMGRAW